MKQFSTIELHIDDKIATLSLQKGGTHDGITPQKVLEINEALNVIEDHSTINVLVIKGGEDNFCNGINPTDFGLLEEQPHIHAFQKWEKLCRRLERLNKHTITVITGKCQGAGLQLAMTCDICLVAENAIFHIKELEQGFLPGIILLNLAKYVGLGRAKKLIFEAHPFTAQEAMSWGLVSHVYAHDTFDQEVINYLESAVKLSPDLAQLTRRLLIEAYATSYEDFVGNYLAAQHRAINQTELSKMIHKELSN
ncbi:MAG: enoyl-CoA hydratase/isomerase family protein [Flammeovirgaceae bacterium]